MNIVKSLHSSLLHRSFSHREKHYFTVSVLWGFNLVSGEPVLEQALWQAIGELLGKGEIFDTGMPAPNAEFLVHGSCFAPDGGSVEASRVVVTLGDKTKELMVFGERQWIKSLGVGWGVTDPKPFTEMAVSYTRAFGGKDYPPNPVGVGIEEINIDGEMVIPVPNIEYLDQLIGSPSDRPVPASLNRTDSMCEERLSKGGTYDQRYVQTTMPAFPDDMDYDYFHDAASDQRISGNFIGTEQYEIRNMHPQRPLITGQLPGTKGRAFVNHEVNGQLKFKEIPTELDTVWFFPAAELGVLIHRGTIEVAEDDGADIRQLLVANENMTDSQRSLEHYQEAMAQRTDPKEAIKYLMFTAPLIPEGCICAFDAMQDSDTFPLELKASENMANFVETKKQENEQQQAEQVEELQKQLVANGASAAELEQLTKLASVASEATADPSPELATIKALTEKIMPKMADNPDKLDLSKLNLKAVDELKAYMEKLKDDKTNEVKANLAGQIEALKENDTANASSREIQNLEKVLIEMDLPPILPRIDADQMLKPFRQQKEQLDKQLVVMQSMGMSQENLEQIQLASNLESVEQQARAGIDKAKDAYRISAHYIDEARSPHDGDEVTIKKSFMAALQSRAEISGGDYAFVDLSGLDLSGIDLTGAYLEYVNLTGAKLTDVNLTNAIFSHAIIEQTQFINCNFTGANLGGIEMIDSVFKDSDLTEATLGKSYIKNTRFENCKMSDKLDRFHETRYSQASFVNSDLRKSAFIDADISGCDFTGSDLSESNFINPVMKNVNFENANLSGVNVVNGDAESSKFNSAKMINVRFVAESTLVNAQFNAADISESNLRDCNLTKSSFSNAVMTKTDFSGANLASASFENARAVQAQFIKSDLTRANFCKIDLMEGSLHKARLSGTQFEGANLYSVNFLGCIVDQTDFTGAYLEKTILKDWRP